MSDFKILLTDGLGKNGQAILRESAQVDLQNGINADDLLNIIGEYDALIVRSRTKVNAKLLAAAPRLKVVGRAGVGVDNIDLNAAREHGVTIVNTPESTTISVAEHTFALLLSLARSIPTADASMKAGNWLKNDLQGVELYRKTLGIIGVGRIGNAVAERASAFRMRVIGYDPYLSEEQVRTNGALPATLEELFAQSDYITLHIPLTDQTRNMLNEAAFGQMKPGVRIICAARGGVIDETALLAALESGQVAGAALDVFAQEPPGLTPLVAHPKVIAVPHVGAQTIEAQVRAAEDVAHEVLSALRGETLRWRVV
ncbi:MAG TPA: hydroxyacid dehydrogenase [Anaerolineales bacterium]|nr:hydroxyacid dehydrogenase [Anaerolineales bacterium]